MCTIVHRKNIKCRKKREVIIYQICVRSLQRIIKQRKNNKLKLGDYWNYDDYIFCNKKVSL